VTLQMSVVGCTAVLSVSEWSGRDQPVADECSDLTACLVVCMATHSATEGCYRYHGGDRL